MVAAARNVVTLCLGPHEGSQPCSHYGTTSVVLPECGPTTMVLPVWSYHYGTSNVVLPHFLLPYSLKACHFLLYIQVPPFKLPIVMVWRTPPPNGFPCHFPCVSFFLFSA